MRLPNVSIRISDYKCFNTFGYGYNEIKPLNLIIGRNNSGKSTMLDLIEYLTAPKDLAHLGHKGSKPKVILSSVLSENDLRRAFAETASGGPIPGNHWNFGKQWIGKPISWQVNHNSFDFVSTDPPFGLANLESIQVRLAKDKGNPFVAFTFKRVLADRDIRPEATDDAGLAIAPTGEGATRTIQKFINQATLPSELVEKTLLEDLNKIFEPDGTFTDILVQQLSDGKWELYLEESGKGRVPLTHSGSGIKTILLVLAFIHLVPAFEGKPLSEYMFGFEELENNLHPALQRRLLLYLRNKALSSECTFFLTTHSNVAIDLFARDDNAQILHVTHSGECASVKRVTTYVENKGLLDDLDIRASDLLQSNGIIWVEGPSDRLYFNHWINLWSDGKIKEGAHYQCVSYGGRLLAHLSASDPDVCSDDVVKILRVNRNAILIIDSDRAKEEEELNATKQRLIDEIRAMGGMAWVTMGREVENYLPSEAIANYLDDKSIKLDRFSEMSEVLDAANKNGKRFLRNKVMFAEQIIPFITKHDVLKTLDLESKLTEACDRIMQWNGQTRQ